MTLREVENPFSIDRNFHQRAGARLPQLLIQILPLQTYTKPKQNWFKFQTSNFKTKPIINIIISHLWDASLKERREKKKKRMEKSVKNGATPFTDHRTRPRREKLTKQDGYASNHN